MEETVTVTRKFNAVTPRPRYDGQGTWWHKVGTAIENDKGQIMLYLDSMPAPDKEKGSYNICLFEQDEDAKFKTNTPRSGEAPRRNRSTDDDDEIPF
jgi:hypothetical protein